MQKCIIVYVTYREVLPSFFPQASSLLLLQSSVMCWNTLKHGSNVEKVPPSQQRIDTEESLNIWSYPKSLSCAFKKALWAATFPVLLLRPGTVWNWFIKIKMNHQMQIQVQLHYLRGTFWKTWRFGCSDPTPFTAFPAPRKLSDWEPNPHRSQLFAFSSSAHQWGPHALLPIPQESHLVPLRCISEPSDSLESHFPQTVLKEHVRLEALPGEVPLGSTSVIRLWDGPLAAWVVEMKLVNNSAVPHRRTAPVWFNPADLSWRQL